MSQSLALHEIHGGADRHNISKKIDDFTDLSMRKETAYQHNLLAVTQATYNNSCQCFQNFLILNSTKTIHNVE